MEYRLFRETFEAPIMRPYGLPQAAGNRGRRERFEIIPGAARPIILYRRIEPRAKVLAGLTRISHRFTSRGRRKDAVARRTTQCAFGTLGERSAPA